MGKSLIEIVREKIGTAYTPEKISTAKVGTISSTAKTGVVASSIGGTKSYDTTEMQTAYNGLKDNYDKMMETFDSIKKLLNQLSESNIYTGEEAARITENINITQTQISTNTSIFEEALADLQQQTNKIQSAFPGTVGGLGSGSSSSSGSSSGSSSSSASGFEGTGDSSSETQPKNTTPNYSGKYQTSAISKTVQQDQERGEKRTANERTKAALETLRGNGVLRDKPKSATKFSSVTKGVSNDLYKKTSTTSTKTTKTTSTKTVSTKTTTSNVTGGKSSTATYSNPKQPTKVSKK